jgi:3-deoxy-D-manno-octulosonic acid kinase
VTASAPPAGYVRRRVAGAEVTARAESADAVASALDGRTLYLWAAAHPARRALAGRAPVYAVPLPNGERVVVRHSRHGGLLARVTGDRFLYPTRAPAELAAALRLAAAGVPTPEVVGFVRYGAGPLLCRADVATREIADAEDLGAVLAEPARARDASAWLPAVLRLLALMQRAGARHPDLNVKNVLLARGPAGPVAHVLDVDRVSFGAPGDARLAAANARRLVRSARKRRAQGLGAVTDESLAALLAHARHAPTPARGAAPVG